MKDIFRGLLLALFLHATFAFAAPVAVQPATTASACAEHYDIVIGVSDKDKLELALSNAQNLQAELGAPCTNIEIVNFSAAVTLLGPMSPKATLLKDAILHGVKIIACQNSMNKFQMTEDDLLPGITTVASGASEIVKRQKQGWTYLRP
jgi:uncharacterized protein